MSAVLHSRGSWKDERDEGSRLRLRSDWSSEWMGSGEGSLELDGVHS